LVNRAEREGFAGGGWVNKADYPKRAITNQVYKIGDSWHRYLGSGYWVETDRPMKNYPRCKTCKWLGALNLEGTGGVCKLSLSIHNERKYDGISKFNAFVLEDVLVISDKKAGVWVDSDFGCIQHEPKESE
jgi:hypothetical protein